VFTASALYLRRALRYIFGMEWSPETLPDDPATLKAMIIAQQVETTRLQASVRAYEVLIQALKIRIAKLQRQKFGPSSEKIQREIEQLGLTLEDLEVAMAMAEVSDNADERDAAEAQFVEKASRASAASHVSTRRLRANATCSTPGTAAPPCAELVMAASNCSASITFPSGRTLRPRRERADFGQTSSSPQTWGLNQITISGNIVVAERATFPGLPGPSRQVFVFLRASP